MSQLCPTRKLILRASLLSVLGLITLGAGSALAAGSTITGTLTAGGTTASASDMKVQLYSTLNSSYNPASATVYTTVNGTTENFSIPGVAAGTYYLYAYDTTAGDDDAPVYLGGATAPTASLIRVDGNNPAAVGTVALPSGGTLSGTISSAAGGVAGAGQVAVIPSPSLSYSAPQTQNGVVQSNGTYSISGLPAGRYLVEYGGTGVSPYLGTEVYSTAGPTMALAEATPVSVSLGATSTVNFSVPQSGSITGTVTAGATNTPLSNVDVLLFDSHGNGVSEAQTDGNGVYAFTGVLDGSYKVEAVPSAAATGVYSSTEINNLAYQFYSGASSLSGATPITVSATGTMSNINLSLAVAGAVGGTVVSARGGAPIGLESVRLVDKTGHVLDATITANDGTYSFPGVPAGTFYVEFGGDTYLSTVSEFFSGQVYATEMYGGTPGLAGAKAVTVTAGQAVTGINGALLPDSTAKVGLPTVSKGKLSGIAKHKAALSMKVAAGSGLSADLATVTLKLPSGLGWDTKTIAKDLSLGGAKFTRSLSKGVLTLSFKPGERGFTLSIKAGAITVTKPLAAKAKEKKLASESIGLTVVDSQGVSTALKLTVKKPT